MLSTRRRARINANWAFQFETLTTPERRGTNSSGALLGLPRRSCWTEKPEVVVWIGEAGKTCLMGNLEKLGGRLKPAGECGR